jgi:hypothetical protein
MEQRFFVQHQDMTAGRTGENWVQRFDTLEAAKAALDGVWDPSNLDVRQEITDTETGERWHRGQGGSEWWHRDAPRRGDESETALRIVRQATDDD